jgi:hypothetical protein
MIDAAKQILNHEDNLINLIYRNKRQEIALPKTPDLPKVMIMNPVAFAIVLNGSP